jgi:hypothetical protein
MENDGKELERLVQIIEKSLDPTATVDHDVQMPILTSNIGATTQCDVVIRTGSPSRETVTIVEVQDRGSKPVANDFRGWQKKLEEVGAQHLICVSRKGFTSSEKERASQSGNTIRLITIEELDVDKIPLNFLDIKFKFDDFNLTVVENMKQEVSTSLITSLGLSESDVNVKGTNINDKVFSFDKKNQLNTFKLCRDHFVKPKNSTGGRGTISFPIDRQAPLHLLVKGQFVPIGLEFDFEWSFTKHEVPITTLTYEQDEYGVLAWVCGVLFNSSRGIISMNIPVKKTEGGFQLGFFAAEMPTGSELKIEIGNKE